MQTTDFIANEDLNAFLEYLFSIGKVEIYESYSGLEQDLVQFKSFEDLRKYVGSPKENEISSVNLALYFPESIGKIQINRIHVNPKYTNGKKFRFRIDGWGLIQLNFDFKESDSKIKCRISVNSEKRAQNWRNINPEMGNPENWSWKIINSKARKLIYRLKKYAQQ